MASKSAQTPQEHMHGGVAAGRHGSEGQSRGPHLALAHHSCGDRGLEAPKGSRVVCVCVRACVCVCVRACVPVALSLIHISEPTRLALI
eukprot:14311517-Alexandrium_andersonii.AAC.1